MSVYLCFHDNDWMEREEDGPVLTPTIISDWAGPIPRVGEFVWGKNKGWWEVQSVAYSAMYEKHYAELASKPDAWVDIRVRFVTYDPREKP